METLLQDLRYGIRVLLRNRAISGIAVVVLAIGIGANTTIFSIINAVLLNPLPFHKPDQLVWLFGTQTQIAEAPVSYADYLDWKARTQKFKNICAFVGYTSLNLAGKGEAQQLRGVYVAADLFPMIGVQPMLGRNFLPSEDKPDNYRVAILSYPVWQRFGSDRSLVGKTLKLDGFNYTVVGIMPKGFQFPIIGGDWTLPADIWIPLPLVPRRVNDRNTNMLNIIGRLKENVTIQQAQIEMNTIAKRMEQEYPATNTGDGIKLVALHNRIVRDSRFTLLILFATVSLILLIACANVANLLLARAVTRKREVALRIALGAGRYRMIRQLLTESVVLAFAGAVLGLLIAYWSTRTLIALSPGNIPRLSEAALDLRVLAFTISVSLLTGIIFGLVPALQLSKTDLNDSLKESDRGGTSSIRSGRIRNLLVVSEVALALMLLISGGLLMKSFLKVIRMEPGFNPQNVLTMELALTFGKYTTVESQVPFFKQVVEHTKSLPGVEAVGGTSILPMSGGESSTIFNIEGRPSPPENQLPWASFRWVTPDYFRTMGISLLKGRDFTERDDENAPKVVIINERMARQNWPNENPIGQRINIRYGTGKFVREIVGVVSNIHHFGLDKDENPEFYMPIYENPRWFMSLAVRAKTNPMVLADEIRKVVAKFDKDQPVVNVKTMETILAESMAPRKLSMSLMLVFAGIALMLASIGVYSVISYSVAQRTHEVGIRMALGAQTSNVLKMMLLQGIYPVLVGILIGLAGAWGLTRWMQSMLFHVSTTDPWTFILVPVLLVLIAVLASYFPARRAAKVDPVIALRYE
jgi:putative ABC transport system permease protein